MTGNKNSPLHLGFQPHFRVDSQFDSLDFLNERPMGEVFETRNA